MKFAHTLVILAGFAVSSVQAQVRVSDPWVRATVAQQKATGAFMQLTSPADTKLVSATSPVAAIVEVHEMAMENDVMRMRQIPSVALPAGKPVALQPGGFHIMLINLKHQVKPGETVPLTLTFENSRGTRETVNVSAQVRALNTVAQPPGTDAHQHH